MTGEPLTTVGLLVVGIGGLAGVIRHLYGRVGAESQRNADLSERVGRMEGRQQGVEDLAQEALAAVRASKQCRYKPPADELP